MAVDIHRILHAGYSFSCNETTIVFDPIFENPFSRNCFAFPSVDFDLEQIKTLQFSAVFISHFHDDHCSLESLNLISRNTPIYFFCLFEEIHQMIRSLGFKEVIPLRLDFPIKVGPFQITARRALDVEVDSIFEIQIKGLKILNVVDSWIDDETLQIFSKTAPWDLILWPFQTMRELEVLSPYRATAPSFQIPSEWRTQLKSLKPRFIIPSSCQFKLEDWSWYNKYFFPISYSQFDSDIQEVLPNTKVIRMNPSDGFRLHDISIEKIHNLEWIRTYSSKNVDYEFDCNLSPPPTSEVARHFPLLGTPQTIEVVEYCKNKLITDYRSLSPPESQYFDKPLFWRLRLYEQDGRFKEFNYLLNGSNTEICDVSERVFGWITDLPIYKLFSALNTGESLTSMYMRINDEELHPDIEAKISKIDLTEDPLVRCLFNSSPGSYQREQLRKIKMASITI